jgi:tetratricopeptide (TPR) repeat protein
VGSRRKAGRNPERATQASVTGPSPGPDLTALGLVTLVLLAVAVVFFRVARHGFLNWDDPEVLVANPALDAPGVVGWAFTTTHIGHYQPLAWVTWAALRRLFGTGAAVHHAAALVLHLVNTALVFALGRRLAYRGLPAGAARAAGAVAALVFGLHPLRVEPVAWASAFPYVLGMAPLLASVLLYLHYAETGDRRALVLSVTAFAVSALCRPMAPGLALVLLGLDALYDRFDRGLGRVLAEKVPYAAIGLVAAWVEGGARRFASLQAIGVADRVEAAAWAPFVYLGRTLWPAGLTPLDPLPIESHRPLLGAVVACSALALAALAAWRVRRREPAAAAGFLAFLVLTAPVAGLTPSGLQATADRYAYLPGVALALLAGGVFARAWQVPGRRPALVGVAVAAAAALGAMSLGYLAHWRDSVSLWTRALSLESKNDVALYNLALALEEAGDVDGALRRYEELLRLVPEHAPARHNRDLLLARRFEQQGNAEAQQGRLAEAVATYTRALELDPGRLHSRRSRGMAEAELGRCAAAIPDLAAAQAAAPETAVGHALTYCREKEKAPETRRSPGR